MIHSAHSLSPARLRPPLLHLGIASTLAAASILLGLAPNLHSPKLSSAFSSVAAAQAISDAEIENYARSVLQIEPIRREALSQMQNIVGSGASIPNFMCNRPNSLNNLPQQVRQIAVEYCRDSAQIAARNDLPTGRFNAITAAQQSDATLAERIRQAMIRLQRNP